MDFRHFFTNQTWWGKLIGAFFGFLIAGAAGALLGILIGNFFDRALSQHFSKPFWHYHIEKNESIQLLFLEAIFSTMGHIAKANGRVSEQAIQLARDIMQKMHLTNKQKKTAQAYFNKGKEPTFNLQPMLTALYQSIGNNPNLIKYYIETTYQATQLGGLSAKKVHIMNTILNYMHLAPLNQQHRFSEDFGFQSNKQNYSSYRADSAHNSKQNPPKNATSHNPLISEAYVLLGIQPTATKPEVKRAYRRQMSRNHPDKLIAKGLPEHRIKAANEKTQQIRKAYEQICINNGW